MIAAPGRLLAAVAVSAAVAAGIAGCGESDSTTTPGPDSAALQKFQACLSEHGVEPPQGGAPPAAGQPPTTPARPPRGGIPGRGGEPSKKIQRAMQACRQYAPSGGPSGAAPGGFPGAPPS